MKQYEYKYLILRNENEWSVNEEETQNTRLLNELGIQGYDIVSTNMCDKRYFLRVILKREIEPVVRSETDERKLEPNL